MSVPLRVVLDAALARPVSAPTTSVYFVAADRAIKIGFAADVGARIAQLQTGCPTELHLLAVLPGTLADEHRLRVRFRHLRLRGEWFRCEPELLSFVESLPGADTERLAVLRSLVCREELAPSAKP